MSIRVTCSACSAEFAADDPTAPRTRCPNCGESAAPPPPRAKRVMRDRPRRRHKDRPAKKRWSLALVLGITGGAILLCGGGSIGLWFLASLLGGSGKVPSTTSNVPNVPPEPPPLVLTRDHLKQVKAGMTWEEVEAILGNKSYILPESELNTVLFDLPAPERDQVRDRWDEKNERGHVWGWKSGSDFVLVGFTTFPQGGTVSGVLGNIDHTVEEPIKLPPVSHNPNPKPVDLKESYAFPVATLTPTELAENHAKYQGQWVVVAGKVKRGMEPLPDDKWSEMGWENAQFEQQGLPIEMSSYRHLRPERSLFKAGDEVEVLGRVEWHYGERSIELKSCLIQKPAVEVDAVTLVEEHLKDAKATREKYGNKPLKITGVMQERGNTYGWMVASRKGEPHAYIHFSSLDLQDGDRVTILTSGPWKGALDRNNPREFRASGRVIALSR